jgi:hypothetical protein
MFFLETRDIAVSKWDIRDEWKARFLQEQLRRTDSTPLKTRHKIAGNKLEQAHELIEAEWHRRRRMFSFGYDSHLKSLRAQTDRTFRVSVCLFPLRKIGVQFFLSPHFTTPHYGRYVWMMRHLHRFTLRFGINVDGRAIVASCKSMGRYMPIIEHEKREHPIPWRGFSHFFDSASGSSSVQTPIPTLPVPIPPLIARQDLPKDVAEKLQLRELRELRELRAKELRSEIT